MADVLMGGLPEIKLWQDRIFNGLRFQQKIGRAQEWLRYKAYYRHEYASNTLPVNIMFSILRSLSPQIVLRRPKITVTPRKSGHLAELNARIVQKLDNWLIQELAVKGELKKMLADAFFTGTATGFTGYDSMFGFDKDLASPDGSFSMSQFDKKGHRIEFNKHVQPGMPWFLRNRPEDTIFPWGCTSLASADWVAMRIFRRVTDLQKDKKYSHTKDLVGEIIPVRTYPEGGRVTDWKEANMYSPDPEARWVELWQVHDSRSGNVFAFTMSNNEMLRKDTDEMQIDGLPAETLTFNPDPDYIYGIPDARIIEPQLMELMDVRTQAMRHRQVNILKALIKKGALSAEEKQKLKNGDVQALVEVDTEMGIRDCVVPLNPQASGILQDLTFFGGVVMQDVRDTVGFSRVMQGDYQGKTHVSAAETNQVMQSADIRLDERRDQMADMLGRVVKKFNQYIFKYWTSDRVESIVGKDGAQWWLKFNGPDIKDDYDLMIEPEEGGSLDTNTKRQDFMEVAKVWAELNAGAIQQGMPIPEEIQRVLFGTFDDLGMDVDKLIAQTGAIGQAAQKAMQMQAQMGGAGGSKGKPISPGMLAQIHGAGGRNGAAGNMQGGQRPVGNQPPVVGR